LIEAILSLALPLIERFTAPGCGVRENIPTQKLVRIFIGNIMAFYLTELLMSNVSIPPGLRDVTLEDFLEVFMHGILKKDEG
jgi:hypothetical protein